MLWQSLTDPCIVDVIHHICAEFNIRESSRPACVEIRNFFRTLQFSRNASIQSSIFHLSLASIMFMFGSGAMAQVNVLTQHNDIARTSQNVQETILTPSNVNPTQFGKLFSQPVNGGSMHSHSTSRMSPFLAKGRTT